MSFQMHHGGASPQKGQLLPTLPSPRILQGAPLTSPFPTPRPPLRAEGGSSHREGVGRRLVWGVKGTSEQGSGQLGTCPRGAGGCRRQDHTYSDRAGVLRLGGHGHTLTLSRRQMEAHPFSTLVVLAKPGGPRGSPDGFASHRPAALDPPGESLAFSASVFTRVLSLPDPRPREANLSTSSPLPVGLPLSHRDGNVLLHPPPAPPCSDSRGEARMPIHLGDVALSSLSKPPVLNIGCTLESRGRF